MRKKEEHEARKERQRRLREETQRLQEESQAHRAARDAAKVEADKKKLVRWRQAYDDRWAKLLERLPEGFETVSLAFEDIPWPVSEQPSRVSIETLSKESVSSFLLSIPLDAEVLSKDIIRSSLLRFHPDKFTSRVLSRVRTDDVERTREAANIVVRILNDMAKDYR